MRFDVFTLFPDIFAPYLGISILQRAIEKGLLEVHLHDIRAWTTDKHHVTDDTPYGGGGGMVMKPEPIFTAVEDVLGSPPECPLILLTPQGRVFNQRIAEEFAAYPRLALLSGRYEGIDERVRQHLVTDEISIGDYVLTGGELPALIVMDAIARLLPGVLGDPTGAQDDSHASGCWNIPITLARPSSEIGLCRMCSFPAITPRSTNGAGNSPCAAPACAAPTCSRNST
jgi:tRNA (guanine37-N1)-methyltransferase